MISLTIPNVGYAQGIGIAANIDAVLNDAQREAVQDQLKAIVPLEKGVAVYNVTTGAEGVIEADLLKSGGVDMGLVRYVADDTLELVPASELERL